MGPVTVAIAGLTMGLSLSPRPAPLVRWQADIAAAAARFGLPTRWIERVMLAESGGHTRRGGASIRSRAGAIGLMQLMPATWATIRAQLRLGGDPDNPRDNIIAGTFYLRMMYDRFGYPGLFAAYNAGPARYAAHLAIGRRLPAETVAYLAKVAARDRQVDANPAIPPALFVLRTSGMTAVEQPPTGVLFAVNHDGR